jgi:hypothetical protein
MKYLFLLTILLSCKGDPGKVIVAHNDSDTATQAIVKRELTSGDFDDPYETGKDTIRLNRAIDIIFRFPEVQALNKQIGKESKGAHGVSIRVDNNFNGDSTYYHFIVGDNSHEDRYVNVYDFLLDKKTNEISAYDPVPDTILNLQDWRKSRK